MTNKMCFIAFTFFFSEIISACDCPKITTIDQDFSSSKFVAHGVVNEIKADTSKGFSEGLVGKFQVLEVFKGSASSIKFVRGGTHSSGGSCMVKLEPGEYLIYSDEEVAFVSSCHFSERIERYSKEKKDSLLKSLRNLSQQQPLAN